MSPASVDSALEETMEAMESVKAAGNVRYLGISNFSAADTRKVKELSEIVTWQGPYNAIERNSSS